MRIKQTLGGKNSRVEWKSSTRLGQNQPKKNHCITLINILNCQFSFNFCYFAINFQDVLNPPPHDNFNLNFQPSDLWRSFEHHPLDNFQLQGVICTTLPDSIRCMVSGGKKIKSSPLESMTRLSTNSCSRVGHSFVQQQSTNVKSLLLLLLLVIVRITSYLGDNLAPMNTLDLINAVRGNNILHIVHNLAAEIHAFDIHKLCRHTIRTMIARNIKSCQFFASVWLVGVPAYI